MAPGEGGGGKVASSSSSSPLGPKEAEMLGNPCAPRAGAGPVMPTRLGWGDTTRSPQPNRPLVWQDPAGTSSDAKGTEGLGGPWNQPAGFVPGRGASGSVQVPPPRQRASAPLFLGGKPAKRTLPLLGS